MAGAVVGKPNGWRVNGPGGIWSIWDHGDEMTVCRGPSFTDDLVARIRPELCKRLDKGGKWQHVVSAASAIHTASLLDSDSPVFRLLWE